MVTETEFLFHLAKQHPFIKDVVGWVDFESDELDVQLERNNVCCKLSGMVTEAKWRDWRPADFHTYLDIVVEAFGPQRLMIGSDWPVCTLSADYEQVMTIVIDYVGQLSPDERSAILGGTCARFYGLDTAADDGDA